MKKATTYRIAYKYRAYCNRRTREAAIRWMVDMANVWNDALAERQESYEASKTDPTVKPINHKWKQYHHVSRRKHPELKHVNILALQAVTAKLHDSYRSFFALIKTDPDARPPREKGIHRIIELGRVANKPFGWTLDGKYLHIDNCGRFKLKLHRPIEGQIKTVTIRLHRNRWYVCFSCEVPLPEYEPPRRKRLVRIRFEDNVFIRDTDGREIPHPEFYFKSIERLRRLSRSLSRKQKGSRGRKAARYTLQKHHEHIANKRRYFLEHIANEYVNKYDVIEVPKVPFKQKITHATTSRKAMMLCDAAYAMFVNILVFDAKKKGIEVIKYVL
jgi:putative transposase